MEKYIVPVRITATENCVNCDSIVVDSPRQAVVIPNHDKTYAERCVTIKRNGYILLDFGKELHGGICITVQSANGSNAMLEAVFGESAMEALSKRGEKNSDNHHSIRYWTIPAVAMSTQEFGSTGFRFVKISAVDGDIMLSSVKAVLKKRNLEYKGSFECNDDLLNEIWKTGAYTVHHEKEKMCRDYIKKDNSAATGTALIEVSSETAENRIIVIKGVCDNVSSGDILAAEKEFEKCDVVLTQLETNIESVISAKKLAQKYNKVFILNPAPFQDIPKELFDGTDYITPNETEAEFFTGIPVTDVESAKNAQMHFTAWE